MTIPVFPNLYKASLLFSDPPDHKWLINLAIAIEGPASSLSGDRHGLSLPELRGSLCEMFVDANLIDQKSHH